MSVAIAKTILEQIGGNKFITMTGAKNLLAHESGLSFKLPSRFAKNGINYVKITLDPDDTYIMYFGKIFKHTCRKNNLGENAEDLLRVCQNLLHQLSTDSDLETITGAKKYKTLENRIRIITANATGN